MKNHITIILAAIMTLSATAASAQNDYNSLSLSEKATLIIHSDKNISYFYINENALPYLDASSLQSQEIQIRAVQPFEGTYSAVAVYNDGTVAPLTLKYTGADFLPMYRIKKADFNLQKKNYIMKRNGLLPITVSRYMDLFLNFPAGIETVECERGELLKWETVTIPSSGRKNLLRLTASDTFNGKTLLYVYLTNGASYTMEVFYSYYKDQISEMYSVIR